MHSMDTLTIFTAQQLIYIMGLAALLYALFRLTKHEQKDLLVRAVITVFVCIIIVKLVSNLYYNPRPFVEGNFTALFPHVASNGFPSNHSVAATITALLFWKYDRKIASVLFILAVTVGLARVSAGVHHIEDIFGGVIIGILAISIANACVRLMNLNDKPPAR